MFIVSHSALKNCSASAAALRASSASFSLVAPEGRLGVGAWALRGSDKQGTNLERLCEPLRSEKD